MRALLRSARKMLAIWGFLTVVAVLAFRGGAMPGWFSGLMMAVALSCIGQFAVAGGWYIARAWRDSRDLTAALDQDLKAQREANQFREDLEAALATGRQVIAATEDANEMLRSPRWAYSPQNSWVYVNGGWHPAPMRIIDTGPHSVPDEDLIHFFAKPEDNDYRP